MNNKSLFKNNLVVSPPSQYVKLTVGETHSGSIAVTNGSSSTGTMEFSASIVPYNINAGSYSTDFDPNNAYGDIVDWVSIDTDHGFLEPNETITIKYTIDTPIDAPAGGQYCAIAIRNMNNNEGGLINDVVEIASVILARVEGDVVESGEILSSSSPSIVFTPPITTSYSFQNNGNVHLNAYINTQITNAIDGEVIYNSREHSATITETIMPGTTRAVEYDFNVPELGILNFTQTAVFNGKKTDIEQTIFVCPIWFLVLVLVTMAAIVGTTIGGIAKHKRSKK